MTDINQFYTKILNSVGIRVMNGVCEYDMGDNEFIPLTVKGKTLVLPTKEHLSNPNWDAKQPFHPLCESVITKDSVVFNKLKDLMTTQIFSQMSLLLYRLSGITADVEQHKKLTIAQSKVLDCAPEADDKFTVTVGKVVMKTEPLKGTHRLVSLVVSRNKVLGDREYTRVGRAAFMIFKDLMKNQDDIFGVKLRKKDKTYLINLLKYILPDIIDDDGYAIGSSSGIAPNFHALCSVYAKVMKDLNSKLKLFKFDTIDVDWASELDNLNKYKGLVPILPGNKGEDEVSQKPTLSRPEVTTPMPQPVTPVVKPVQTPVKPVQQVVQPAVQQVVQPVQSQGGAKSWAEQRAALTNPHVPATPVYAMPTPVQGSNAPGWMVNDGLAGPKPQQPQQVFRPGYPQVNNAVYPQPVNNGYPQYQQVPMGYPQPQVGYAQPQSVYPQGSYPQQYGAPMGYIR